MSVSKRHHFLPIFHLKHFTVNGFFYIYDVKKGQFKGSGKKYAPKTHFYESEGNTLSKGLVSSDFIEKGFTYWDNWVAEIYNRVTTGNDLTGYTLSHQDWTVLQHFVNIVHWRNPSNVGDIKKFIAEAENLNHFNVGPVTLINQEELTENQKIILLKQLKTDPDFYKALRLLMPSIKYPELFEKKEADFAHIFTFPDTLPKLIGDNPIIYRNIPERTLNTDDFIFPLTPTKVLFRNTFKRMLVHSYVRFLIDLMQLLQAKEYISCTDLAYPDLLKELYESRYANIESVREEIFLNIHLQLDEE